MISAKDIKELREATGAGMLDCKKALNEAEGSFDKAVEILREKGQVKAAKKSSRDVHEGLCAIKQDGNTAALVQFACETDFVAKTDQFNNYLTELTSLVFASEKSGDLTSEFQESQQDTLTNLIATIGENMRIIKAYKMVSDNTCSSYLHANKKVAVLVDVSSNIDDALKMQLSMHIAAASPQYLTTEDVTEEKKQEIRKEAEENNEKAEEKILEFCKDFCLMNQEWSFDGGLTVKDVCKDIEIYNFVRAQIG